MKSLRTQESAPMDAHELPAVPEGNSPKLTATLADGPVHGALLPLVRINGEPFVLENCLHFFPAVNPVPQKENNHA
jgi:hypothetical protein